MDELKIAVTAGPAHTLVTVAGECDLNTGRQLRDVLTSEVSRGVRRLILDLSELTFMDSTGMQVLLSIRTVLTVRGGTLALVSPQPVVARILALTGADELIPIFDSLRDAQTADSAGSGPGVRGRARGDGVRRSATHSCGSGNPQSGDGGCGDRPCFCGTARVRAPGLLTSPSGKPACA